MYGIANSNRTNLRRDELAAYRLLADEYLALDSSGLEAALGLSEAGVMPKQTMRKFDEMCLTPVAEMTVERWKKRQRQKEA